MAGHLLPFDMPMFDWDSNVVYVTCHFHFVLISFPDCLTEERDSRTQSSDGLLCPFSLSCCHWCTFCWRSPTMLVLWWLIHHHHIRLILCAMRRQNVFFCVRVRQANMRRQQFTFSFHSERTTSRSIPCRMEGINAFIHLINYPKYVERPPKIYGCKARTRTGPLNAHQIHQPTDLVVLFREMCEFRANCVLCVCNHILCTHTICW